jgi:hypothetical protein
VLTSFKIPHDPPMMLESIGKEIKLPYANPYVRYLAMQK